jgi:hypothetical protein
MGRRLLLVGIRWRGNVQALSDRPHLDRRVTFPNTRGRERALSGGLDLHRSEGHLRPMRPWDARPTSLPLLTGLLVAVLTFFLASCQARSHLVVYNQTTVPIVFNEGARDLFVSPCSVARFVFGSGWQPEDPPTQPSSAPTNPSRVVFGVGPPVEAVQDVTVWVTTSGVHVSYPIVVPSLPPCVGVPPTPAPGLYISPMPSRSP